MLTLDECATVPEVIELYESVDGDEDFTADVVFRIAEIVAEIL